MQGHSEEKDYFRFILGAFTLQISEKHAAFLRDFLLAVFF